MKKHMLHFQQFIPQDLRGAAEGLRGAKLRFGPHATEKWKARFGSIRYPKSLPSDASVLEMTLLESSENLALDTVLYRYKLDEFTDTILSVAIKTKFVVSVWRVPRWFGMNAGRPKNPSKYLTLKSYGEISMKGGSHDTRAIRSL